MRYRDDPFWMNAKFPGKDFYGVGFNRGARIFYYPRTKKIFTGEAAEQASRDFEAAKMDEAVYRGDYL
jgi:hypothetical protein